jgi:DNA-binding NarL/FixJ family response regulator
VAIRSEARIQAQEWLSEPQLANSSEPEAWSVVATGLRVAAVVISLDDMMIRAVTVAGRRLIGRPSHDIVGHHISQYIDTPDRAGMVGALAALRAGAIVFYRAHLGGLAAGGEVNPLIAWVHALDVAGQRVALAAWERSNDLPSLAHGDLVGRAVAVALVDAFGATKAATVELPIDGLTTDDLLGSQLVPADDLDPLVSFSVPGSQREAISITYAAEITTGTGRIVTLDALSTALAGSTDRLVLLIRPTPTPRELALEGHLRRIAIEIEASGILARSASTPEVALARLAGASMLTARQREVLRRLVAGQRVRTIAVELFVSQSTVRNHLSAIFEHFGVHSQAELLERMSRTDTSSS